MYSVNADIEYGNASFKQTNVKQLPEYIYIYIALKSLINMQRDNKIALIISTK